LTLGRQGCFIGDMTSEKNRRYPRVPVEIDATLCILLPEQTFQPIVKSAKIVDLSERGAMVEFHGDDSIVRELLRATRYCRLGINPGQGLPEKLIGKAVWVQPISEESGGVRCRLGLYFEEVDEAIVEQLRAYVTKRLRELAAEESQR